MATPERRDPGIPWRGMQLGEPPALRDLPGSVLATLGPDDQDLHGARLRSGAGVQKKGEDCGRRTSMAEPGLDRPRMGAGMEAARAARGRLLRRSAWRSTTGSSADAGGGGYPVDTPDPVDDEGIDPEVLACYRAAYEIRMIVDGGEDFDPGDVGQAIGLYQESTSTSPEPPWTPISASPRRPLAGI